MSDDIAVLDFMLEFWVPGHGETIRFPWALEVDRTITDVQQVMDYAHAQLIGMMGQQKRITVVDTRYNHHVVEWDKIAAVSILAPDADSLPWAGEGEV